MTNTDAPARLAELRDAVEAAGRSIAEVAGALHPERSAEADALWRARPWRPLDIARLSLEGERLAAMVKAYQAMLAEAERVADLVPK